MIINQSDRMLADDDDDVEREKRGGVHEKVTCLFMPIARNEGRNHPSLDVNAAGL
jgi:hypothetical protein